MKWDISGGATSNSMSPDCSVGVSEGRSAWQPKLMSSFSFFHHHYDRTVICCRCHPTELSHSHQTLDLPPQPQQSAPGIKVGCNPSLLTQQGQALLPARLCSRMNSGKQHLQCCDWLGNNVQASELYTFHIFSCRFVKIRGERSPEERCEDSHRPSKKS